MAIPFFLGDVVPHVNFRTVCFMSRASVVKESAVLCKGQWDSDLKAVTLGEKLKKRANKMNGKNEERLMLISDLSFPVIKVSLFSLLNKR